MDAETREAGQMAYEVAADGRPDWRWDLLIAESKERWARLERIVYAAGFEAAREMAAGVAYDCANDAARSESIRATAGDIAADIRSLKPEETDR